VGVSARDSHFSSPFSSNSSIFFRALSQPEPIPFQHIRFIFVSKGSKDDNMTPIYCLDVLGVVNGLGSKQSYAVEDLKEELKEDLKEDLLLS